MYLPDRVRSEALELMPVADLREVCRITAAYPEFGERVPDLPIQYQDFVESGCRVWYAYSVFGPMRLVLMHVEPVPDSARVDASRLLRMAERILGVLSSLRDLL